MKGQMVINTNETRARDDYEWLGEWNKIEARRADTVVNKGDESEAAGNDRMLWLCGGRKWFTVKLDQEINENNNNNK